MDPSILPDQFHAKNNPANVKIRCGMWACWLNLIEPWWKQLRSLALKGRRFETTDELINTLKAALVYWNAHCHPYQWKKKPQEQFTILGGHGISTQVVY
jgi:hypothetical protein